MPASEADKNDVSLWESKAAGFQAGCLCSLIRIYIVELDQLEIYRGEVIHAHFTSKYSVVDLVDPGVIANPRTR